MGFLPLLRSALSEGKCVIRLVRDWQSRSLLERLHEANSYSSAQVEWAWLSPYASNIQPLLMESKERLLAREGMNAS